MLGKNIIFTLILVILCTAETTSCTKMGYIRQTDFVEPSETQSKTGQAPPINSSSQQTSQQQDPHSQKP